MFTYGYLWHYFQTFFDILFFIKFFKAWPSFLGLKFSTLNVQPKQGFGLYAGRLIRDYRR